MIAVTTKGNAVTRRDFYLYITAGFTAGVMP